MEKESLLQIQGTLSSAAGRMISYLEKDLFTSLPMSRVLETSTEDKFRDTSCSEKNRKPFLGNSMRADLSMKCSLSIKSKENQKL